MERVILAVCLTLMSLLPVAATQTDDFRSVARQKFDEQRFGIFIHWGLYSYYAQGEWYLQAKRMSEDDYAQMMNAFYPSKFDARRWAKCFRNAGARYVTFTSRHHDGFSMWPSKVANGYSIAETPFQRDVVGELSEACKAEGLQFNIYYSLMDWHHPNYPVGREWRARKTLKNRNEDYRLYKKFMLDQLTELLDAYRPGVIWFDGEWDHDASFSHIAFPIDWEFEDIYSLVHSKGALVANNHHHCIREDEDIQIFERYLPGEKNTTGLASAKSVARKRPLEQCDVLQAGIWGFKIEEAAYRTGEEVVAQIARAAGKGINLIMNIGPRADGSFPKEIERSLSETGKWFEHNGESIYGTVSGGFTTGSDIVSTRKGNCLYLHFVNPKATTFAFKLDEKVEGGACLSGGVANVEQLKSGIVLVTLGREDGNVMDCVVKLTLEGTR